METLTIRVNAIKGFKVTTVKHRIFVIIITATTMASVRIETLIIHVSVNQNIMEQTVNL